MCYIGLGGDVSEAVPHLLPQNVIIAIVHEESLLRLGRLASTCLFKEALKSAELFQGISRILGVVVKLLSNRVIYVGEERKYARGFELLLYEVGGELQRGCDAAIGINDYLA
jgi:hypothetical protein